MNTARLPFAVALTAGSVAARAHADVSVAWNAAGGIGSHLWTNAARWGLDPDCGLYPLNNTPECCDCMPDPRWSVTVNSGTGPNMDVDSTLVGVNLLRGAISLNGHILTVEELMVLGDGNAANGPPAFRDNAAGRVLNLGACEVTEDVNFDIEGFDNEGTMIFLNGADAALLWRTCQLYNHPAADIEFQGAGSLLTYSGPGQELYSDGTITKTFGGTSRIGPPFFQSAFGSIHVVSGTLELTHNADIAGPITLERGGVFKHVGGAYAINVTAPVSGTGSVVLGNQVVATFSGPYDVGDFTYIDGADANFTGGPATQKLWLQSSRTRLRGAFLVRDSLDWLAGTIDGGTLDLRDDTRIGSSTSIPILDAGALIIGESGQAYIKDLGMRGLNNALIQNDGALILLDDSPMDAVPINAATVINNGVFIKLQPGSTFIDWRIENHGYIEARAGTLALQGEFRQYGRGETELTGGILDPVAPAVLEILGGALTGNGTIQGAIRIGLNGRIAPGNSQSYGHFAINEADLTIEGDAEFNIGGRTRGTEYDALTGGTGVDIVLDQSGSLTLIVDPAFARFLRRSDAFILMETGGTPVQGTFTNAKNGDRLNTDGRNGSFRVFYGPDSRFPPHQVVVTDYTPMQIAP